MMVKNFSSFTPEQLRSIQLKILKHLSLLAECFNPVFVKIDQCNDCRFYYVCDGISKVYLEIFGDEEFKPLPGDKILNPEELLGKKSKLTLVQRLANYCFFSYAKVMYFLMSVFLKNKIDRAYKLMNEITLGKK